MKLIKNMSDKKTVLERIDKAIQDVKDKNFTLFFFVVGTHGVPNGAMSYIYQMAWYFHMNNYNVKMLYQMPKELSEDEINEMKKKDMEPSDDEVFVDASSWMGKAYSGLPHMNISKEEWQVSPSDFLFIPEVFSGLMFETYKNKIPCKRYVILSDFNYVTEFIPLGVEWSNYGIFDAICTTKVQEQKIKDVFPYIRTHILNPYIDDCFRPGVKPKKLIINIMTKDQRDVNRIIKPFYWKYSIYKFVSFRDLRNFPRETYADLLKESAITVWMDVDTPFGYGPLEAMRCGNIVVGKIPNSINEWMIKDGVLRNNMIWFDDIDKVPSILASVIGSWMRDDIPSELTDEMNDTNKMYTFGEWKANADELMDNMIGDRIKELQELKIIAKNGKGKDE